MIPEEKEMKVEMQPFRLRDIEDISIPAQKSNVRLFHSNRALCCASLSSLSIASLGTFCFVYFGSSSMTRLASPMFLLLLVASGLISEKFIDRFFQKEEQSAPDSYNHIIYALP